MTDHPLRDEEARILIATMPIERMGNEILLAVENGFDGIQFYSRSGNGKTWAAEYLCIHQIQWQPKPSAMALVVVPRRTTTSDNSFYKVLQRRLGAGGPTGNAAVDRLLVVVDRMCDACQAVKRRRFFLFIDEAQLLTADDYDFLVNIYNFMVAGGFMLFCVFLNQSDDGQTNERKRKKKRPDDFTHTFRRFFICKEAFHPLRGLDEIAYSLGRFDDMEHEGIPFPASFSPMAWERGWRLASDAGKVVTAIQKLRAESGLGEGNELPMSVFSTVLRRLLVRVAGEDPAFVALTVDQIVLALRRSGYVELERVRQRQVMPEGVV